MARWCEVKRTQFDLLASPGFLCGLSLLLLNDFVLKRYLHGGLSGKLSDFAGLFVFPLFWVALFPRLRNVIYILTPALFVFWKSSYSRQLIEWWNALPFFGVSRTVDYSDLMALFILPLSYRYSLRHWSPPKRRRWLYVIGTISVFAFAATSFSSKTEYDNQYNFPFSKQELLERMSRLSNQEVVGAFWEAEEFRVVLDPCIRHATIAVSESEQRAVITLREIDYRCPTTPGKEANRKYFENEFINKLNAPTVTKSVLIHSIWGVRKDLPEDAIPAPSDNKSRPVKPKR